MPAAIPAAAPRSTESGDVGAALFEIVSALGVGHFRGNQTNRGQHRAIVQPNLGGTKALLWDSLGNGGPSARLRVYAEVDSIWFTVNAAWGANAWVKDTTAYFAGGFRFSRNDFEILQDATTNVLSFTSWGRSMRLPMGSSAFEATGSIQETGRCGVKPWNPLTAATFTVGGATTNFRCRFPSTPSSVTLTMRGVSPASGVVTSVDTITRDGFALTVYHPTMPASTSGYWYGDYTAVY